MQQTGQTTNPEPQTTTERSLAAARAGLSGQRVVATGISLWKRRRMRDILAAVYGRPPRFRVSAKGAIARARRDGVSVLVWATREPAGLVDAAAAAEVPIVRIEDGFIRSVGLGADFTPAASIVLDRRGIYYDPSRPSDLEVLLNETDFDGAMLRRAAKLIARVVEGGVTKYNVGGPAYRPLAPDGMRIIFVPGQVEDDASVLKGGCGVDGNLDLLARVRAERPNDWIVYKPHPDVEAGHRKGAVEEAAVLLHADEIVRGVSATILIAICDEVHTLTSLCGFEALLRRRPVFTYGQPFYAGWGLTADHAPPVRRRKPLSIEALAAGALIAYPLYYDPAARCLCEPEDLVTRLSKPRRPAFSLLIQARRLQGAVRRRLAPLR